MDKRRSLCNGSDGRESALGLKVVVVVLVFVSKHGHCIGGHGMAWWWWWCNETQSNPPIPRRWAGGLAQTEPCSHRRDVPDAWAWVRGTGEFASPGHIIWGHIEYDMPTYVDLVCVGEVTLESALYRSIYM